MASPVVNKQTLPHAQRKDLTPAMRQWADQKAQAGDAILLFRMGDFYETFYEDAETAARVLGITLTRRDKNIPLAGIPYHALDNYLAKLVTAGLRVAISEQTEDPKQAKGVVRRDIVRIVTPGTITEDNILQGSRSNFIAAVHTHQSAVACACLDLAAGDFFTMQADEGRLLNELTRIAPSEILISDEATQSEESLAAQLHDQLKARIDRRPRHEFDAYHAQRVLLEQFEVDSLAGFGYEHLDAAVLAAGAVLAFVKETQKTALNHITSMQARNLSRYVEIDSYTWRSLEIERTLRTGSEDGSLYAAVNRTVTRMGGRKLREVLRFPLRDPEQIRRRQQAVLDMTSAAHLLDALRAHLSDICDIERVTARLGLSRCSPRDLLGLGRSLQTAELILQKLHEAQISLPTTCRYPPEELADLQGFLLTALSENAPATLREGGVIATGFDAELDRLRNIGSSGRQWLAQYQASEIDRTKIPTLKIGFNKVFGYYIEVTHPHKNLVPQDYIRKQTIKNAERYITEALKDFEAEALSAEEKSKELEYRLFEDIKSKAAEYIPQLLTTARAIATLDVLAGFAALALERSYHRPEITDIPELDIIDGRHPVLEQLLGHEFVPNDTTTDTSAARMLIITGPNMAGKSTYIRQVALLTLLAQTGSFVPAQSMRFGLVDRIFARVGASDELIRGQSTFMVEMIEAANILNNATAQSLVILDELGRGTSTYDGLSLAWAICEHIAGHLKCRTLFATHYHELTELAQLLPAVKNYNVAVREWPGEAAASDKIVFLHKIVPGATDKSYGVHVAQIAGIPQSVVQRSQQVLNHLESGLSRRSLRDVLTGQTSSTQDQLELFSVQEDKLRQLLLEIDLDCLTPLQGLQILKQLQDEAR